MQAGGEDEKISLLLSGLFISACAATLAVIALKFPLLRFNIGLAKCPYKW
jgi:hypothetical protein